jgi:hypothetical protein
MTITDRRGLFSRIYTISGQRTPYYQGWTSESYGHIEESICIVFETRRRALETVLELRFAESGQ